MAKIKNWSRRKSMENRIAHVVYSWINSKLPVERTVRVEKFRGQPYVVSYSEQVNPILETDNKRVAYTRAIEWMRNNPAPDYPS